MLELLARGGEHVPLAPIEVEALALDLAALRVLEEAVERVALVGHLRLAVTAVQHAEQRGAGARPGLRLAADEDGGPRLGARAVAGALALVIRLEEVERAPPGVDHDLAERRGRDSDREAARPGLLPRGTGAGREREPRKKRREC